jgi:hypothetical protein
MPLGQARPRLQVSGQDSLPDVASDGLGEVERHPFSRQCAYCPFLHPAFKRTFHAGWYINIAAIAVLRNDASASDSVKVQFLLIQTKAKLSNVQFCSCVKPFIECQW